jgi:hypothetical protein
MIPVENYLFNQKEPYQSIMIYVRSVILKTFPEVAEKFSYGIPFYYYKKKPMVYINRLKGTNYVDVSFMDGNHLKGKFPQLKDYKNRKRVRSIQVNNLEDFDEQAFVNILNEATLFITKNRSKL